MGNEAKTAEVIAEEKKEKFFSGKCACDEVLWTDEKKKYLTARLIDVPNTSSGVADRTWEWICSTCGTVYHEVPELILL